MTRRAEPSWSSISYFVPAGSSSFSPSSNCLMMASIGLSVRVGCRRFLDEQLDRPGDVTGGVIVGGSESAFSTSVRRASGRTAWSNYAGSASGSARRTNPEKSSAALPIASFRPNGRMLACRGGLPGRPVGTERHVGRVIHRQVFDAEFDEGQGPLADRGPGRPCNPGPAASSPASGRDGTTSSRTGRSRAIPRRDGRTLPGLRLVGQQLHRRLQRHGRADEGELGLLELAVLEAELLPSPDFSASNNQWRGMLLANVATSMLGSGGCPAAYIS